VTVSAVIGRITGLLPPGAGLPGTVLFDPQSDGQIGNTEGVVTSRADAPAGTFVESFAVAMAQHRHWARSQQEQVPA